MVLELEKCCFCGDLRTGSLIIGYLTLTRDIIVSLVSLIIFILSATTTIYIGGFVIAVFSILLLFGIANIIFTIIMLIGIHEYKRGHVKAYLIFNAVIMVIAVLLNLILCIVAELPALIILGLVFLAFHSYYLLVIRSYYLKIDDPMKQPAILRIPEGPPLTAEQLA